jgi:caffeoyl-CoA O-methyltransferase
VTPKSFLLTEQLLEYLLAHCEPIDDVQHALISATEKLGGVARMQVSPEQGALLTMLTRLAGTVRAVEVGTFTGYSALCIARGLSQGGSLLCCDVSEEWTTIAREHWQRAAVADRIELRIAPAIETLRSLPADPVIDLAFIDADKSSYTAYVDELVPRLRPNGLLLIDNVLWGGAVIAQNADDPDTVAIRACNDHVAAHPDLESLILPVADGLTLARKR